MEEDIQSIKLDGDNNVVIQSVKDSQITVNTILWDDFVKRYTLEKDDRIKELKFTISVLQDNAALLKDSKIALNERILSLSQELHSVKVERENIEKQLQDIIKNTPDNISKASEFYRQAYTLFIDGDLNEAINTLDDYTLEKEEQLIEERESKLLRDRGALVDTRFLKAQMLTLTHRFDEAENNYRQAIRLDPSWRSYQKLGFFYNYINKLDDAQEMYTMALSVFDGPIREHVAILNDLAVTQMHQNKLDVSANNFNKAIEIYSDINQDELDLSDKFLSAAILNNLALLQSKTGEFSIAEISLNKSLSLISESYHTGNEYAASKTSSILINLGNLQMDKFNFILAEKYYCDSYEIRSQLISTDYEKYSVEWADILGNMGAYYKRVNSIEKAKDFLGKAIKICEDLVEHSPYLHSGRLAVNLGNLADLHNDNNEYDSAIEVFSRVIDIFRELVKYDHNQYIEDLSVALYSISIVYRRMGKLDLSEKSLMKCLSIRKKLLEENRQAFLSLVAETLGTLSNLNMERYDLEPAESYSLEALAMHRELSVENPNIYNLSICITLNSLGNIQFLKGDYKASEDSYKEGIKICDTNYQDNPSAVTEIKGTMHMGLSTTNFKQKKLDESEKNVKIYLEIFKNLYVVNKKAYFSKLINGMVNLANVYEARREYVLAQNILTESLDILYEAKHINRHNFMELESNILFNIANNQNFNKQVDDADKTYNQVLQIKRQLAKISPDKSLIELSNVLQNISAFYCENKINKDASVAYAQEAIAIIEPKYRMLGNHGQRMRILLYILNQWSKI